MISTWHDFFKVGGEYSQRNLTVFISMMVGSAVNIYMALNGTLTGEIFIGYMFAGGGVYGVGKLSDDKTARSRIELDKPSPALPTPSTTINVGAEQPGKVKDMNVEAEGDVVVASKAKPKRRR